MSLPKISFLPALFFVLILPAWGQAQLVDYYLFDETRTIGGFEDGELRTTTVNSVGLHPTSGNPLTVGLQDGAVLADGFDSFISLAEEGPKTPGAADREQVLRLIEQLGDEQFAVREAAEQELSKYGLAAKDQLLEALKHRDREIRERVKKLLAPLDQQLLERRIEAFLKSQTLPEDEGKEVRYPGWEKLRDRFGDGPDQRKMFAEVFLAESKFLTAYEKGGEALEAYVEDAVPIWKEAPKEGQSAIAIRAMLAAIEPGTKPEHEVQLGIVAITAVRGHADLKDREKHPMFRRLLREWLLGVEDSQYRFEFMMFAMEADLEEGVVMAQKIIEAPESSGEFKGFAASAIGKLGGSEHQAILEPLLNDETVVLSKQNLRVEIENEQREVLVCDMAMAALLHLRGQDLKEYGFDHIQSNPETLFRIRSFHRSPAARAAAREKWANNRQGNIRDRHRDR